MLTLAGLSRVGSAIMSAVVLPGLSVKVSTACSAGARLLTHVVVCSSGLKSCSKLLANDNLAHSKHQPGDLDGRNAVRSSSSLKSRRYLLSSNSHAHYHNRPRDQHHSDSGRVKDALQEAYCICKMHRPLEHLKINLVTCRKCTLVDCSARYKDIRLGRLILMISGCCQ